jgi:tyrosyl-tRNA synthetase
VSGARRLPSAEEQLAIIKRGAAELIGESELKTKLAKGKALRVKAGFDPTTADLHLGHTVVMRKLRDFQDLGHEVIFLIGDFTARIGDPSGRSDMRPTLEPAEIERNATTYQEQAFKILDGTRTRVAWNSEWMNALGAAEFVRLAGEYTVARMLERDDFEKRYKSGHPIGIHEFLYPLIQGYDSCVLAADVEVGGTDQKFNLLVGREIQRRRGQEPQVVLTMPLLEGLDGLQKMSKSLGNFVGIMESAAEIYGKIMSIPDDLMLRYYDLLSTAEASFVNEIRAGKVHPMAAKKELAREIAARYHGATAADAAAVEFERRFQRGGLPDSIAEFAWPDKAENVSVGRLLKETGLASSMSDARRLVSQGAVRVDGARVAEADAVVAARGEVLVQVGKRRLLRVRFAG